MLRIGMRTLNGKARQTAVAAFAHMPDPPPSKIERRAWRRVNMLPARDFAKSGEAESLPLQNKEVNPISEAERIPLPHSGCVKSGEAESFPLQEMILHSTKQRIGS